MTVEELLEQYDKMEAERKAKQKAADAARSHPPLPSPRSTPSSTPSPQPLLTPVPFVTPSPFVASSPSSRSGSFSSASLSSFEDFDLLFFFIALVLFFSVLFLSSANRKLRRSAHDHEQRIKELEKEISFNSRLKSDNESLQNQVESLLSGFDDLRRERDESLEDLGRMRGKFKRMRAGYLDIKWYLELQGGVNEGLIVPPHVSFDDEGLPCGEDASEQIPWGKAYTFYCTPGRSTYHRHGCAHAGILRVHALDVPGMIPCKTCCHELPDLSWYEIYVRIRKMKQDYNL